jgi:hypothetical protein
LPAPTTVTFVMIFGLFLDETLISKVPLSY